jgi:hypothetical protein
LRRTAVPDHVPRVQSDRLLVDEYRIVHQLGDGLPLFAGLTTPLMLDLLEAQAYDGGAVLPIYRGKSTAV